jgi:hypothetical protein
MTRIRVVLGERERVFREAKQRIRVLYAKQKQLERLQQQEEKMKQDLEQLSTAQE